MSIAISVVLLLSPSAQSPSAAQLLAACQTAYAKADRGSFAVQFKSKSSGVSRNGRYTVDYVRPATIRFRSQYDATEVAGSDRTLTMIDGTIHGYDADSNEVLSRPAGKTGSIVQRFGAVFPIDDPIRIIVDTDALETFFAPMKAMKKWTVKSVGGAWVASATSPPPALDPETPRKYAHTIKEKGTSFTLIFDKRSHRIRRVTAVAGTTTLDWTYTESSTRPISFRVPTGAKFVESFYEKPLPPKYASPAARQAIQASVRAYGRLNQLNYSVSDDTGTTKVAYKKDDMLQQSSAGKWTFIGGHLHAEPKGKATVDRKGSWRMVDTVVGQLGMPVEPLLRHLAKGDNPLTSYLGSDLTAKLVGQIGSGKVICDLVQLSGKGLRLTLTIRRDTHLLQAVESANLDARGRVVARSERRFSY